MNKELLLDPKGFKVEDLKKLAEKERIEIPGDVTVKKDIAKYIYDELTKRETEEVSDDENADEQADAEVSTIGIDVSSQSDKTANLIMRTDSTGVHAYDRDTHTSTFTPHEVL